MKIEPKNYPPCKLDGATRKLVELIFDENMFNDAMAAFDIDVKKMPLGNLSQAQVQKGYDVLVDLKFAPALLRLHASVDTSVFVLRC